MKSTMRYFPLKGIKLYRDGDFADCNEAAKWDRLSKTLAYVHGIKAGDLDSPYHHTVHTGIGERKEKIFQCAHFTFNVCTYAAQKRETVLCVYQRKNDDWIRLRRHPYGLCSCLDYDAW